MVGEERTRQGHKGERSLPEQVMVEDEEFLPPLGSPMNSRKMAVKTEAGGLSFHLPITVAFHSICPITTMQHR